VKNLEVILLFLAAIFIIIFLVSKVVNNESLTTFSGVALRFLHVFCFLFILVMIKEERYGICKFKQS
jgi:hypothetical protein